MMWFLLAILITGGVAAILNDAAFGGQLFSSAVVVQTALLAALTLSIGRGFLRRGNSKRWLVHALIWLVVAVVAAALYRLFKH